MKTRSYEGPTLLKVKPLMFFKLKKFAWCTLACPMPRFEMPASSRHCTSRAYLKPADIATIKRYSLVRKDNENESGRTSGGVALLVSHDTPSSVITLHTNLQAVAVRVMLSNLVTVCTLYLPPSTSVNDRDFNRLVDELPTPFIIIGDFNGHSPVWGSKNTNPRGRQIEEFVNTHSLCLLNNGEDTYFHQRSRTFHSLDLALCTPSLAPYFNFRVGVDLRDSAHFPIFWTV
ncbi:hypothetical protein AVEN_57742-1 [Araneus ventricosus]|uniref:Endonuclease/exonuclease/phosphatase domain-containing protein n=1 Tax=Araneus ventricosus TaxID=182803 RepID=A0A4Y2UEB9_ARAVE|nr:hypothetical protein AVEN_57742-1 [Araneus ventricosus]